MAGLREQKKRQTRRHISDVATVMFLERGFDEVTVTEVAEAAGCSKMTVFNYFPRKEDLVLDRTAEQTAGLVDVISGRGDESIAAALRRHHHAQLVEGNPLFGGMADVRPLWELVSATPALLARVHEQRAELAAAITDTLSTEMPLLEAKIVAGMISTTQGCLFELVVTRAMGELGAKRAHDEQAKAIDRAFDLLENGLAAL